MVTLSTDNRRLLERTIVDARALAERAARAALEALAVGRAKPDGHMNDGQKALRNHLRARARQLGDKRAANDTHEIEHLVRECAYEHWHRMLFARFLAENNLLIEPDAGVAISLDECKELAKEDKTDLWTLAGRYAQRMLPQIFRADDPVLKVRLAREDELKLEGLVDRLPVDAFTATDSLGWCYQFWQTDEKKRVNEAETKIGADELPAVTQLFTEDYMVDFLLDNTLGAWWWGRCAAAQGSAFRVQGCKTEEECRRKIALPGCEWKYLRFVKDEKAGWRPAAGTLDGWPKTSKELECMDPCCGSGHFLVALFERLVALRMAEEGLIKRKAAETVVRDNIFGLEIDPRCTQIAAFNLALAAWKFAGHIELPAVNIACCGLAPNCTKEQWLALAEEAAARAGMPAKRDLFGSEDSLLSAPVRGTLTALYDLFSQAPVLGSLINPHDLPHDLFHADYRSVAPLLAAVLKAQSGNDDTRERAIAAAGMARAAKLLEGKYALVATNVPYLARGKQNETLRELGDRRHPEAKNDLATVFLERCLALCTTDGAVSVVLPQNWLFLTSYRKLREKLLKNEAWRLVARLGAQGFQTPMWDFNVQLLTMSHTQSPPTQTLGGLDVSDLRGAQDKAAYLLTAEIKQVEQAKQLENPDAAIAFQFVDPKQTLKQYAQCNQGVNTGDSCRFTVCFWELPCISWEWAPFQSAPGNETLFSGCFGLLRWEQGKGVLAKSPQARICGQSAWNHCGVGIGVTGRLRKAIYSGGMFDGTFAVITAEDDALTPVVTAAVMDSGYEQRVRNVDQALSVTESSFLKVPFDLDRWQKVAAEKYPNGLPAPYSSDPTQWIFDGQPAGSDHPLHVAVARLLGYQWPRQTGSSFRDCPTLGPDGLEKLANDDGIVCVPSVRGERSATDRLLALLMAVGIKADRDLDEWLRSSFFEEHCTLFHDRPFVWHIWDGRKRDGFHALVNYHKLADGVKGRRLLEKLTHAYLGDWITRQRADVKDEKEGAEERLAAALALKERLEAIIEGEPPFDIFVRWKPLAKQAIGWEPDINDGVRINIRPFVASDLPGGKKGAGVLRSMPKIKWTKDRGKEPNRPKDEYPWFWSWDEKTKDFMGGKSFDGNRWNDCHYSNDVKRKARG